LAARIKKRFLDRGHGYGDMATLSDECEVRLLECVPSSAPNRNKAISPKRGMRPSKLSRTIRPVPLIPVHCNTKAMAPRFPRWGAAIPTLGSRVMLAQQPSYQQLSIAKD